MSRPLNGDAAPLLFGLILLALGAAPTTARAAPPGPPAVEAPALPPPSPFETGLNGFGMGLTAGLAGGYLVARDDGLTRRDWRPLVAGAGIGALAGGALGLTFGLIDSNSSTRGRGYLVMRDMVRGGQFGLIAGGIAGGLAALSTDHAENILFGAAIGTLTGTALGLVVGGVERNPWAPPAVAPASPVAWNVGLAPVLNPRGEASWGPSLCGTF